MAHVARDGHSINGSDFFNTLGLLSELLLHVLIDAALGLIQPAQHVLRSRDELAPPLIWLLVLILIRGPVLLILSQHWLTFSISMPFVWRSFMHSAVTLAKFFP